ncbi:MAG: hypothetical protein KBT19_09250 [Lachnospiraceae bacterium]|nr:hypothetical protein [Candidatus Colinaster equi]
MKERILSYRHRIDDSLQGKIEVDSWQRLLDEHLIQIGFFQHERLIHLLVTLTFAILTVASVLTIIVTQYYPLAALTVLLMILLIPYISHYYLLENEVQKMYAQYDEIIKRINDVSKEKKES